MADDRFTGALRVGATSSHPKPYEHSSTLHPSLPDATSRGPQFAVRGRLNAIVLDLLLVGVATRLLIAAFGDPVRATDALLVFMGVQFAYFFVYEVRTGQTIGKRLFGVRVSTLTGARVTARQVAVRNALRVLDALPILYASGLISLMRTGSARRQRIGDVLAGTVVVVDSSGKPLRTPRWLLPIATILATGASVAVLLPILSSHRPASIPVAHGFEGNSGQAPAEGPWLATGRTTSSIGYSNMTAGDQFVKRWQITRTCNRASACSFVIKLEPPHESPISAELIQRADGWHATLPTRLHVCGYTAAGQTIYWRQYSTMVFRFVDAGRSVEANGRDFSEAAACGYGTDTMAWTARHL